MVVVVVGEAAVVHRLALATPSPGVEGGGGPPDGCGGPFTGGAAAKDVPRPGTDGAGWGCPPPGTETGGGESVLPVTPRPVPAKQRAALCSVAVGSLLVLLGVHG